ncbi:MAG TPA: hypothetical protein VMU95_09085 [Trebonia sp.]|nr:hypothetical protein [Trebonia sp.]
MRNTTPSVIAYAVELISADAGQLAAWHGTRDEDYLTLDGPCPHCGHDAPNNVPLSLNVLEAGRSGPHPATRTVRLDCTCEQVHGGRPDNVATGCGRSWIAVATDSGNGTVLAPPTGPDADPVLLAAARAARDAGPAQLSAVRSAAEKWIGGVTALFGLFGLAGVAFTRSTVDGLDLTWQLLIGLTALVAVAAAGFSIWSTYRAAYGWQTRADVSDNDRLREWYLSQEKAPFVLARYLRAGVRAAIGSLAALAVTMGLLWFAPQSPALTRVTLVNGSQVCGTLLPAASGGVALVSQASDGQVASIPLRSVAGLAAVTAC